MSSLWAVVYTVRLYLAGCHSRVWIQQLIKQINDENILSWDERQGQDYSARTWGGNAIISRREYDISAVHSHGTTWGGEIKYNVSLPRKPAHVHEVQGRKKVSESDLDRGGTPEELNENIPCRSSSVWGGSAEYYINAVKDHHPYILESFYYSDETTEKLIPYYGDFLLDSGAFTFFTQKGAHKNDYEEYLERYADFIVRNKVQKFFELDIDSIVGYEKVLQYRKRLEQLTGRQCIPVWHSNRGVKEFEKSCHEYGYVALGGLVGTGKTEYSKKYWDMFPWFIKTAHKNGAKIHALGFTSLEGIKKYHFDSVDSTAWTTGNRFGFIYQFKDGDMKKIDVPKGKRLADSRRVALINYCEWIKFQKWAEAHL